MEINIYYMYIHICIEYQSQNYNNKNLIESKLLYKKNT